MRRNVLVIGMARSGTSLTVSIFSRNGYWIGPIQRVRTAEGDEHNPFGYFEADELIEHNVAILGRAGCPHHNTWNLGRVDPDCERRIAALPVDPADRRFLEDCERNAPWAWKDPRLCYTLAYWGRLLDPERTALVHVVRDPEEIVFSFRRLGWCGGDVSSRQEVLERIEQHEAAARAALAGLPIPQVEVAYSDYFERPAETALRLAGATGLPLDATDLNALPELNHSAPGNRRTALMRIALLWLPERTRRWLRRYAPRRLLALLFPEWRHVRSGS